MGASGATWTTCALVALSACSGGGTVGEHLSPSQAARACAWVASCSMGAGGSCASTVVGAEAYGQIFADPTSIGAIVDCEGSSGGCSAFTHCLSHGHDAAYCDTHPAISCDGDFLVDCPGGGGPADVVDCSASGQHCLAGGGELGCSTGVSCGMTSSMPRCDGRMFVQCDTALTLETRTDCGQVYANGACATTASGAECVPDGPACDGATLDHCEGNALVTCERGHQLRIDCAVLGATCTATGTAVCQPTGTACAYDTPDRCSGTQLQTCVGGNFVSTDCTSLGFRTCGVAFGAAACVS